MSEENKNEVANADGTKTVKIGKFTLTRGKTAAIIIIVIIIVAAIAAFAWHNTPGFCGTMCHDTMSYYSDGYANSKTMLSYQHGHIDGSAKDTLKAGISDSNSECLTCHEAKLGEQITELGMQLDGNYTIDTNGKLVIANGQYKATKEYCLKCHDYEKVIEATANYNGGSHTSEAGAFNPHASHQGDLDCGTCHKVHGTSVLYCTSCHNAEVPEGWMTVQEALDYGTDA